MPPRKHIDQDSDKQIPMFKILPVDATVLKGNAETQAAAEPAPVAESLVRVHIVRKFMLNRDDRTVQTFDPKGTNCDEPGYYDVTPEDANHPYLIAHTDKAPAVEYAPGSLQFAQERQKEVWLQTLKDLEQRQRENDAIAELRRQERASLREKMGGDKSGLEDPNI